MSWTDERIDRLKSMWEKGLTASQIADELGVEGTYRWRVGRKYAKLDEFISLCYEAWDSIKLRKREINLMPAVSERDNVVLLQMSGRG